MTIDTFIGMLERHLDTKYRVVVPRDVFKNRVSQLLYFIFDNQPYKDLYFDRPDEKRIVLYRKSGNDIMPITHYKGERPLSDIEALSGLINSGISEEYCIVTDNNKNIRLYSRLDWELVSEADKQKYWLTAASEIISLDSKNRLIFSDDMIAIFKDEGINFVGNYLRFNGKGSYYLLTPINK